MSASGGGGVHHIAFGCADIFATGRAAARQRRALRADLGQLLRRPARRASTSTRRCSQRLRELGVLFDRSAAGDYFHIYTESFADRFFFEIVQRVGYDGYGALNAPARMASQAQAAGAEG